MSVSTTTIKSPFVPRFMTVTDVAMDNSYQEGGEPLTAAQLGLSSVEFAICTIKRGTESEEFVSGAYYSETEEKLHLIDNKTGKEVAGTKNMEKVLVRVLAFGKARAK